MKTIKVLFVCVANICRSPTAQGVFRDLVKAHGMEDSIEIDSAGILDVYSGRAPDDRAQAAALSRGCNISKLRAREISEEDYLDFDYLLAMDMDIFLRLSDNSPVGLEERVQLFMDYATETRMREVPDPYRGKADDFERVFDMVVDGSRGLLEHIKRRHF